jgi:hypothetical protein
VKRLVFVLFLSLLGSCTFAAAAGASSSATLTLSGSPSVEAGTGLILSGALTGVPAASGRPVELVRFSGYGCATTLSDSTITTDANGGYREVVSTTVADLGHWSFQALFYDRQHRLKASSACANVAVVNQPVSETPRPEDEAFLCYSVYESDPAVFPVSTASTLLSGQGYWSPYAVPGNVAGGTNIGAYHLACNLTSGQSVADTTLGAAGELYAADSKQELQDVPGHYAVIGG